MYSEIKKVLQDEIIQEKLKTSKYYDETKIGDILSKINDNYDDYEKVAKTISATVAEIEGVHSTTYRIKSL